MARSNLLNNKIVQSLEIFEKIKPNAEQLQIIEQTCKLLENRQKNVEKTDAHRA